MERGIRARRSGAYRADNDPPFPRHRPCRIVRRPRGDGGGLRSPARVHPRAGGARQSRRETFGKASAKVFSVARDADL